MSGRVRDAFAARGWEAWSADLLPCERPGWTEVDWPSEEARGSARHYQGDVRDLFNWSHPVNRERWEKSVAAPIASVELWDLVIAFPPCTHLALSGARYWKEKQQLRWNGVEWLPSLQTEAYNFFMEMVQAPAPYIAVENPVGIMGRKKDPLYRVPDQVVHPWMFGDPLVKATCLWLRGLPPLTATHTRDNYEQLQRVATGGGSYRVDKRNTGKANNGHEDQLGRAYRTVMRGLTPPGLAARMAAQWGPYVEERAG